MENLSLNSNKIVCGPFIRKTDKKSTALWFVTDAFYEFDVKLTLASGKTPEFLSEQQTTRIGRSCYINQIQLNAVDSWPLGQHLGISLEVDEQEITLGHLALEGFVRPGFIVNDRVHSVIQGSCRKPDHPSRDAFTGIKAHIESDAAPRPDFLLMAGDQVYVDDVAAPMLVAIQTLSAKLGIYSALHDKGTIDKSRLAWQESINGRKALLPKKTDQNAWQKFWYGQDIISSRYHDNHLIALDEMFACYLLTWSSHCWSLVIDEVKAASEHFTGEAKRRYDTELATLLQFADDLPAFETVLANVPTLMMFDDHDVTDDWNLSADWEEHVYNNDTTRHMIRDALLAYTLFQGGGNDPARMASLLKQIRSLAVQADFAGEQLTESLFEFNHWHYELNTQPNIVVLDTRTHRWRSETSLKNPSGLMDWERLEHLQQQLFEATESILVVSPAPVFGVKSIEVVQKGCEIVGQELLVDVENWMAHQGSANKLMSMLRHDKAPDEVIIMSGDVHYSFCFSAERRFSSSTDKIWQLTCSGFKNEFPQKLLKFFDYIDRFLYSPYSLLNIFTKRRKLAIDHHPLFEPSKPNKKGKQRHLHSESVAGLVILNEKGQLQEFSLLTARDEKLTFDLEHGE